MLLKRGTGSWGAGNGERKSVNELSAAASTKIQNGGMTAEKWQRGTGNNRKEHTTCKEAKTWLVWVYTSWWKATNAPVIYTLCSM